MPHPERARWVRQINRIQSRWQLLCDIVVVEAYHMPAEEHKVNLPANITRDEFMRRVAERVWELWRREVALEDERQGKKQRK